MGTVCGHNLWAQAASWATRAQPLAAAPRVGDEQRAGLQAVGLLGPA